MDESRRNMTPSPKCRRGGRWAVFALAIFTAVAGINAWLTWKSFSLPSTAFLPRQMAIAEQRSRAVVGDLGGTPVTVPGAVARFVQYEGDPELGQRRLGPPPERNHQSRILSFGLRLRFPDMATTEQYANWKDMQDTPLSNSNWISVEVASGRRYPGPGFLDRLTDAIVSVRGKYWFTRYIEVPSSIKGLRAYEVEGIDPTSARPWREDKTAQDVFIARDSKGFVKTYITCSNGEVGASCQQTWSMESDGMHVKLTTHYRRGLLDKWKSIQLTVTEKIKSFRPVTS